MDDGFLWCGGFEIGVEDGGVVEEDGGFDLLGLSWMDEWGGVVGELEVVGSEGGCEGVDFGGEFFGSGGWDGVG